MVLALAIGGALEAFADLRFATVLGLLVGLVVANWIPKAGGCRLPR